MRRSLGTAVFSGMLGVTLFGIFLTPVFFYVIQGLGEMRLFMTVAVDPLDRLLRGRQLLGLADRFLAGAGRRRASCRWRWPSAPARAAGRPGRRCGFIARSGRVAHARSSLADYAPRRRRSSVKEGAVVIAHFFIDRPIFATVISLVIMLAGGVAVFTLPVAQYPDVTPPTVQVTAFYPGRQRHSPCATPWPRPSRSRSAASRA